MGIWGEMVAAGGRIQRALLLVAIALSALLHGATAEAVQGRRGGASGTVSGALSLGAGPSNRAGNDEEDDELDLGEASEIYRENTRLKREVSELKQKVSHGCAPPSDTARHEVQDLGADDRLTRRRRMGGVFTEKSRKKAYNEANAAANRAAKAT